MIHAVGFVAVSHLILDIPTFAVKHTIVLFSVSLFGNVLGLLISAMFQSAKVIYIVIPLLVIPQLLLAVPL